MKNKKYLFISCLALLAIFLSACAGNAYASPGQSAGSQTGPIGNPVQGNQSPANQGNQPRTGGPDLTAAAEALGISVEDLQQALQDALPAECLNRNNGQGGPDPDCRPDLEAVASALGVTAEELQSVLTSFTQGKGPGESNLVAAAETLGITVEELQQALESALPEDCSTSNDGQSGPRPDCHPDFEEAAATLGITVEELQSALGGPKGNGQGGLGLNLTTAAETLGVTEEDLQLALQNAVPSDCLASSDGLSGDCRPDLDAVASALGVTVEELQSVLRPQRQGDGLQIQNQNENRQSFQNGQENGNGNGNGQPPQGGQGGGQPPQGGPGGGQPPRGGGGAGRP